MRGGRSGLSGERAKERRDVGELVIQMLGGLFVRAGR